MTKKFCVVPWKELYLTSIGTFRMCCQEDEHVDRQTVMNQGVKVHWDSKHMKQARLDFLNNRAHDACKQCWTDDANGKFSLRQRRNQAYLNAKDHELDPWIDHFKSITDETGHTSSEIQGINLSVGNTCQLRCTHCSPAYSNNVAKDYAKLGWDQDYKARKIFFTDRYLGAHKQSMFDADAWPQLKAIAHNVKWIRCTGGEPTLSRGLLDFMQWLDAQGLAKDIDFGFNTNAMTVKDEWLDAAKKFKHTDCRISIDGSSDIDYYVRYPSNWERKTDCVMKLKQAFPNAYLFNTIYAMNIADLVTFIDTTKEWNVPYDLSLLSYPNALDIRHMPGEFKKEMSKKLFKIWVAEENYISKNGLEAVIKRLNMPGDPELWQEAKQIIQSYDSIRPYTLASASPLLAPYLN